MLLSGLGTSRRLLHRVLTIWGPTSQAHLLSLPFLSSSHNVLISSSLFRSGGSKKVRFVLPLTLFPLARGKTPVAAAGVVSRAALLGQAHARPTLGAWPGSGLRCLQPAPMVLAARASGGTPVLGYSLRFPHVLNLHFSSMILGLKEEWISASHPKMHLPTSQAGAG